MNQSVVALVSSVLLACAGDDAPPASGGPTDASSSNDSAADAGHCPLPDPDPSEGAPLSFAADIFPLLNGTCGSFACHNERFRNANLFLGPSEDEREPTDQDVNDAYQSVLGTSDTAPELARVAPGMPSDSFLMLKVDGCHASLGLSCPSSPQWSPCGERMPSGTDPWPRERRDVIRRWIAQGAPGP